jgi:hypothetical protein
MPLPPGRQVRQTSVTSLSTLDNFSFKKRRSEKFCYILMTLELRLAFQRNDKNFPRLEKAWVRLQFAYTQSRRDESQCPRFLASDFLMAIRGMDSIGKSIWHGRFDRLHPKSERTS